MGVLPKLFKLWPWVDLDLFYAKVKFGHIGLCVGKSENYLFFGTYCSFRSQSHLKHSAKWVYEVEWVSKVKVILWSWSKVTQISKLNVWLLACILRWAIQGLRALLFGWPFTKITQTVPLRWTRWPPELKKTRKKTFKRLLLLNQKIDFKIIIQECFLGDPLSKLLKQFCYVEQNGRQGYT